MTFVEKRLPRRHEVPANMRLDSDGLKTVRDVICGANCTNRLIINDKIDQMPAGYSFNGPNFKKIQRGFEFVHPDG